MPIANVGSKWSDGELIFYSVETGNNIAKFDPTNDRFDILQNLAISGTDISVTAAEINELDLSVVGAINKYKIINMTASDFSDTSEVDTGETLPDSCVIKDVFVNVNTKEDTATAKTIDVGTDNTGDSGDDPNGLLVGASVAAAGLIKGTLVNAGITLGALFQTDTDGASDFAKEPIVDQGGNNITVTAGEAFTEADFDVIIEYIELS